MMGDYLGCECSIPNIQEIAKRLSDEVLEKVNATQELVMVNDFARETNERTFKKCLQDRMSDISSWRWVLEDLSKRLEEASAGLKYELKACKVIAKRINDEIEENSKSRPGVLCPKTDNVEMAIKEERHFLHNSRTTFEGITKQLERKIDYLNSTMNRIKKDILTKEQTLALEESMANITTSSLDTKDIKKKRKKKPTSLENWEYCCQSLKEEGLKALTEALICKQQVRGSRVQLTLAAQSAASKVDAALRRRLHANQAKFMELEWQRDEAEKDLKSLENEQLNTEQSLLGNLEQEKVIEARIADRTFRPNGELTLDEVDYKLRAELCRVRKFVKELRSNREEIICLQDDLKSTISKLIGYLEDLNTIIQLDGARLNYRQGLSGASEQSSPTPNNSINSSRRSSRQNSSINHGERYDRSNDDAIQIEEILTNTNENFEGGPLIENITSDKQRSPSVGSVDTQDRSRVYQSHLAIIQEEDENDDGVDDYPIPY